MSAVKSGTTRDGVKVRVGDFVRPVSFFLNIEFGTVCRITDLRRQGANGTIASFDTPPDPEYPHHFGRSLRYCNSLKRV